MSAAHKMAEALKLARSSHFACFASNPPLNVWKQRGVDNAIGAALAAYEAERAAAEAPGRAAEAISKAKGAAA